MSFVEELEPTFNFLCLSDSLTPFIKFSIDQFNQLENFIYFLLIWLLLKLRMNKKQFNKCIEPFCFSNLPTCIQRLQQNLKDTWTFLFNFDKLLWKVLHKLIFVYWMSEKLLQHNKDYFVWFWKVKAWAIVFWLKI